MLQVFLQFSYESGNETEKTVFSSELEAEIVPPWSSIICFAMARPNPEPPALLRAASMR